MSRCRIVGDWSENASEVFFLSPPKTSLHESVKGGLRVAQGELETSGEWKGSGGKKSDTTR